MLTIVSVIVPRYSSRQRSLILIKIALHREIAGKSVMIHINESIRFSALRIDWKKIHHLRSNHYEVPSGVRSLFYSSFHSKTARTTNGADPYLERGLFEIKFFVRSGMIFGRARNVTRSESCDGAKKRVSKKERRGGKGDRESSEETKTIIVGGTTVRRRVFRVW